MRNEERKINCQQLTVTWDTNHCGDVKSWLGGILDETNTEVGEPGVHWPPKASSFIQLVMSLTRTKSKSGCSSRLALLVIQQGLRITALACQVYIYYCPHLVSRLPVRSLFTHAYSTWIFSSVFLLALYTTVVGIKLSAILLPPPFCMFFS